MFASDFKQMDFERKRRQEERQKEQNEKAPICTNIVEKDHNGHLYEEECKTKTHYVNSCGGYVCINCDTHYSTSGGRMRFCWWGWNKQNYSYSDAGEYWSEEDY